MNTTQTTNFLDALFQELDLYGETNRILIHSFFTDPHAVPECRFFATVEPAVQYLEGVEQKANCYVSQGLRPASFGIGGTKAGREDQLTGIVGLVQDFDIAKPGSAIEYFPSVQTIRDFLQTVNPRPTALVETGGGVHAWWLFHDPWIFKDEQDRNLAMSVSFGWYDHLRSMCDYHMDTTFNLQRIWRIPGLLNFKYDPPLEVKLIAQDTDMSYRRYSPEDHFHQFQKERSAPVTGKLSAMDAALTYDHNEFVDCSPA